MLRACWRSMVDFFRVWCDQGRGATARRLYSEPMGRTIASSHTVALLFGRIFWNRDIREQVFGEHGDRLFDPLQARHDLVHAGRLLLRLVVLGREVVLEVIAT